MNGVAGTCTSKRDVGLQLELEEGRGEAAGSSNDNKDVDGVGLVVACDLSSRRSDGRSNTAL